MSDVEKPEADDALGTEQTHKREDDLKLRKCEMTKIRHHMEKLCITPQAVVAIEKDIERRQLWANMDQLEKMPQLKNNDIQEFEKFSDLVGIIVVKLKAEGRNGELGKGKSHSLLVKKLAEA